VPFINAGSGKSQHPTQALLDAYTIYNELGTLSGLKVAFVGDLLRGRTVESLVQLLSLYEKNELVFIAPENSKIKESIKNDLQDKNIKFEEKDSLESAIEDVDVLYITRIQKERFDSIDEYKQASGKLVLSGELANQMKDSAIIMHPLPRVDEIATGVDDNSRAKYFKQAENGMWVRMALLYKLLAN